MTITICWGLLIEIIRVILEILGVILIILSVKALRQEYRRKKYLGRIVDNAIRKESKTKKGGK